VTIGVISDTHGNVEALRKALRLFEDADIIVHAGDVLYHPPRLGWAEGYDIPEFAATLNGLSTPVVISQGNCDPQVCEELLEMPVQSPYALVEQEGVRVVVTHGHLLFPEQMIGLGRRYKARYLVSGHTHIPVIEDLGDLVLMNPGSPAIPKLEVDGLLAPTVGMITDRGARILHLETGACLMETAR